MLWWLACAYSALVLYGSYHPDELAQITGFVLLKAGVQARGTMPWELAAEIRPWLQPAMYYALLEPLIARFGYHHLVMERLMLLTQLALLSAVLPLFTRAFLPTDPEIRRAPRFRWGALAVGALWFAPGMLVRHSSEAFATALLAGSLGAWAKVEPDSPDGSARRWPLLAGALAALAFFGRFQVGVFLAGFVVTRSLAARRDPRVRRALGLFVASAVCVALVCVAIDAWGYGELVLTPWRYFRENLVSGHAGRFGRSPWAFYLGVGAALTLSPLLWIWLGRASVLTWRTPLYRAITIGGAAFLLVHMAIGHKEARFLVPLLAPGAALLLAMLAEDARAPRRWAWVTAVPYARAVALANVAVLIGYSLLALVDDRSRVELALWRLPAKTTVLGGVDLFSRFDRLFSDAGGVHRAYALDFKKPPGLDYWYVTPPDLAAACAEQPDALALLTGQEADAWDEASKAAPVAGFPPSWARVDAAWYRRIWRYRLVPCSGLAGLPLARKPR